MLSATLRNFPARNITRKLDICEQNIGGALCAKRKCFFSGRSDADLKASIEERLDSDHADQTIIFNNQYLQLACSLIS